MLVEVGKVKADGPCLQTSHGSLRFSSHDPDRQLISTIDQLDKALSLLDLSLALRKMGIHTSLRIPEVGIRAAPPALSDVSELTVLSRTPSPPPELTSLGNPEAGIRATSPTLSDISELTALSRTPSPPLELSSALLSALPVTPPAKVCSPKLRGPGGRFMSASPKRPASPVNRSVL